MFAQSCGRGGTGRRAGLRSLLPQGSGSSILLVRTKDRRSLHVSKGVTFKVKFPLRPCSRAGFRILRRFTFSENGIRYPRAPVLFLGGVSPPRRRGGSPLGRVFHLANHLQCNSLVGNGVRLAILRFCNVDQTRIGVDLCGAFMLSARVEGEFYEASDD